MHTSGRNCMYVYVCIKAYLYTCTHASMYAYACVHTRTCMFMLEILCASMHVCVCECACV